MYDHYGDEGFELELWNGKIESIKQRILNESGVMHETKMKDREPLNKTNINKKGKGRDRIRKLANGIKNTGNLS